jgi:hypothetical protein
MLDMKANLQTDRSGTIGSIANRDARNTSVHHQNHGIVSRRRLTLTQRSP